MRLCPSSGNFYPRPPRGGRPSRNFSTASTMNFYPRPPRGGRPGFPFTNSAYTDFYPRPPRGGRPQQNAPTLFDLLGFLSTPSARRATSAPGCTGCRIAHFYPRPPRGGRRPRMCPNSGFSNFYPRPPRGGRLAQPDATDCQSDISIHALREEGDLDTKSCHDVMCPFLSTPSARRATC